MPQELQLIPARRGRAAKLRKGQSIKIVNTHGQQVVDTWCFHAGDLREFLSMEHLRPTIERIFPHAGDRLVTNRRRPILSFVEDTSPGVHDTLIAACDSYRYFRAELDCVVVMSACPQDILPINGRNRHPTEAHYQVLD